MTIRASTLHRALMASMLSCAAATLPGRTACAGTGTSAIGTASVETTVHSAHLGGELTVLPGVFHPVEAELLVLPFMKENRERFAGKRVLEIGSGSGIVSVYAAKLGATKVVATDVNERAVETTKRNAAKFAVAAVVEPRLVPRSDMSAYSVIAPDETFDMIVSNPPYSLDLDAPTNDAVTDTGDLGFSIVRGLQTHLAPGGAAVLLYGSLFYHLAMVKFARYCGYEVRHHRPRGLTEWEAETLFNHYLARLLEREKVPRGAFRFDRTEPGTVQGIGFLSRGRVTPLFPGNSEKYYPGMIVIERKSSGAK